MIIQGKRIKTSYSFGLQKNAISMKKIFMIFLPLNSFL